MIKSNQSDPNLTTKMKSIKPPSIGASSHIKQSAMVFAKKVKPHSMKPTSLIA